MAIRRAPGFVATAGLTLAIGIGAVVTMASVYSQAVVHPIHVPDPDNLLSLYAVHRSVNFVPPALSWNRFEALRRQSATLTQLAAYSNESVAFSGPGITPEQWRALRVSGDFFGATGLLPLRGRVFTADDDVANGPAVCVLSYDIWQARFGGGDIVGRLITLDGRTREVVGVLRPDVTPPWGDRQIFLPRVFEDSALTPQSIKDGAAFLSVIGRKRPGVSPQQVTDDIRSMSRTYARDFAGHADAASDVEWQTLADAVIGTRRTVYALLLVAVALVLFVSCANAAALLLGRVVSQSREIAIKQAVGAGRARIVRELLIDSLGVSSAAGVAGLVAAAGCLSILQSTIGPALPPGTLLQIDRIAAVVTFGTVLTAALVVGIGPALYVTRAAAATGASFDRGLSDDRRTRRFRAGLVIGEVALSVPLVTGAILLVVSLMRLQAASPGFDPRGVAAGFVTLPANSYPTGERQARFFADVLALVKRDPRVVDAAISFGLPYHDENFASTYSIAGRPIVAASGRARAGLRIVSPEYFRTMRIHLIEGRTFTAADRAGAPGVCVVNRSLAHRQFGGASALGQVVLRGVNADRAFEIVGVVDDVLTNGPRGNIPDEIFFPFAQLPRPTPAIVARSAGNPAELSRVFTAAVAEVDPSLPVARFASMDERLQQTLGPDRILAILASAFAVVAVVLAAVGLYAVLAHGVAARRREIGIRMAIGASRPSIVRLIVTQAARLAGAGVAVGLLGGAGASKLLESQLFGVTARDGWIFVATTAGFAAIGLAAAWLPARRASRVDPLSALGGR